MRGARRRGAVSESVLILLCRGGAGGENRPRFQEPLAQAALRAGLLMEVGGEVGDLLVAEAVDQIGS